MSETPNPNPSKKRRFSCPLTGCQSLKAGMTCAWKILCRHARSAFKMGQQFFLTRKKSCILLFAGVMVFIDRIFVTPEPTFCSAFQSII